jgi:hypothetical protein
MQEYVCAGMHARRFQEEEMPTPRSLCKEESKHARIVHGRLRIGSYL